MANAKRDDNYVTTLLAVSSADGSTPVTLYANPTTHRLLVSVGGSLDDLSDVVITSAAQGDILYHNGTNWVNLAAGTNGQFLKTQGAGANPTWAAATAGAAGADTQVQFNDGGTNLGGDAGLVYNKTTDTLSVNGGILPVTNDTGALGSATLSFADLFLASGGVINFGNGEVTLTSAANSITLAGGDLALGANNLTMTGSIAATGARVTKGWFTDIESTNMPTVGGTAILTSLTAPQFTTIELGHASDTTLARGAAGRLTVEGVNVVTSSSTDTLTNKSIDMANNTLTGTKAQFDTAVSDDNFAYLATAQSFTALQTISVAGVGLRVVNTTDGASVQVAKFEGDRATMADADEAYISLMLSDDGGTQTEFGRITWVATDVNAGTSVDGQIDFAVVTAGSLADEMRLDGTSLSPSSNDGLQLGTTALGWADLHLATGGVINWANGEVTLAAATDTITIAGATLLTGGTSLAVALGTIELGHASDTTIARAAAGRATIESVAIARSSSGSSTDNTLARFDSTTGDLIQTTGIVVDDSNNISGMGNIQLGENSSIDLDPAGSADGKYSGICITGTAGTTLAFGDLIYLAVADSRWELTDADAAATAGTPLIGMCVLAAAADGNATKILLYGQIRADAKFPALTVGATVYVGETAGAIQTSIPTGADNIIRVVGHALTADEILFNPSQDHQVTVA